jgi:regulator of sirC expression with transglutaminase-like and TPR domain
VKTSYSNLYLDRLRELAARPDGAIDLGEGAFLLSKPEYPRMDVGKCVGRLDAMGAHVAGMLSEKMSPLETLTTLCGFLFTQCGYICEPEDSLDPRNAHLNEVLERQEGHVLCLAVLLIELGRRIGLTMYGIPFPGDFLVGCDLPEQVVLAPREGGILLSRAELASRFDTLTDGTMPWSDDLLWSASKRQILVEILTHLKMLYTHTSAVDHAISCISRILIFEPDRWYELRDRGQLYLQKMEVRRGIADLETYLQAQPDAPDLEEVQWALASAKKQLWSLN